MSSELIKHKVLIVDDNATNIYIIESILEDEYDFDIHSASSGEEAFEMMECNDYALILLDMMMPTMSGYEFLDIIRQSDDEAWKEMPIIAVTANAMSGDESLCMRAGASAYISKPLDIDDLFKLINKYIQ